MGIEHLGRVIIANGTQAAVEAINAALAELVWGRDSATGAIGYSIDAGATWVWLPIAAGLTYSDAEGNPLDVDATAAADGTSEFAARRDHRHHLSSHTHTASGGAVVQDEEGNLIYDEEGSLIMEEMLIS